jgi:hypothetical protein
MICFDEASIRARLTTIQPKNFCVGSDDVFGVAKCGKIPLRYEILSLMVLVSESPKLRRRLPTIVMSVQTGPQVPGG